MCKALYADAIAYFEKLEKKHAYQVNKAKSKISSGKRNMQGWQWRHCGKWRGEGYGRKRTNHWKTD